MERLQARLRVGKRLKQLQSARKQLLARLHGLANPTPEVYDEAIEASAALQANMQAHSKVRGPCTRSCCSKGSNSCCCTTRCDEWF